jgi:urease accessory protein
VTPVIAAQQRSEIFAANRARGRVDLAVDGRAGVSRRTRVHESGSLRVRFPRTGARELEAVLVNTAGGMAGGDGFDINVAVGEQARLVVTTTAAEKVYRSLGPDTTVDVKLDVAANASLSWLPQETILFDRARLVRRIEVDLAETARVVLAEALVFGRTGMGEAVAQGLLIDQWRVRRAGRLVHAEGLRLDGTISEKLAQPAVAKGAVAIATVLLVPGDDAMVAAVRAGADRFRGEVGASSWNGIAVVRFCSTDGAALRHDFMQVLAALNVTPLPRLWAVEAGAMA